MRILDLIEMENIVGGTDGPAAPVINTITIACIGVGLLAIAGSIWTFGASLAWGVSVGGAFCTGAAIGTVAYNSTR